MNGSLADVGHGKVDDQGPRGDHRLARPEIRPFCGGLDAIFVGKSLGTKKNTQKWSCFLRENHETLKGNCEYSYVENYCSCVKFRLSHEILFGSERLSTLPGNPLKSPSLSNPMKSHLRSHLKSHRNPMENP